MTIDIDLSFPHHYVCEVLSELPGGAVPRHFFPGSKASGQDGVIVRVRPEGADVWIGMFAFGMFGKAGISRVLSLPDPERLCAVARGAGFVVSASEPDKWETVRAIPITDVQVIPTAELVVFANFTEMVAYGANGVRWCTKRIAWDGLKIVDIGEQRIVGEYWDIRDDAMRTFEVDLETGAVQGGVET